MTRNIIFMLSPYVSHIIASAKIARYFRQRGFSIIYVSNKTLQPAISRYGFYCHESNVKFIWHADQSPYEIKNLLQELKQQYHPVLFFLEVGFWDIALLLKGWSMKYLMIQPWACGDRCAYSPPFYLFRKLQPRNMAVFILNTLIWESYNFYHRFLTRSFWKRYDTIVRLSGLPRSSPYVSFKNRSSICRVLHAPELVLYPPELDFPRKKLHPDTRFIGPFIDPDRAENDFCFDNIDLSKPLVVCSLGSLNYWYSKAENFYQKVINAFSSNTEYTLIMNVGRSMETFRGKDYPGNIHLYRGIPQISLLKKAAFFITHGGASSLKEGIFFGVPMLVYPWILKSDMYENAKRVQYHRLGIIGDIDKDSPADIIRQLAALRSPHITAGIKYMQQVFRQHERSEPAIIDFIESYINN